MDGTRLILRKQSAELRRTAYHWPTQAAKNMSPDAMEPKLKSDLVPAIRKSQTACEFPVERYVTQI